MKNICSVIVAVSMVGCAQAALAAENSERVKAALEKQPTCQKFVRYDDRNVYLGFGQYRQGMENPRLPIPGSMRVVPIDQTAAFDLQTKDGAIDVAIEGDSAFVLTYSAIEEWDLKKRQRIAEYPAYAISTPLRYMEHARAMARYHDKLIIAHGRLGVSFFDLKLKRITNQFRLLSSQLPLESIAMGVTVQGNTAYIVMDNFHVTRPEDGVSVFTGIITVDLENETVLAEMSGMDPGADSVISDGSKVIVSFGGIPIWKYAINTLNGGRRLPEPEARLWKYPVPGAPTGAASLDDKYYYTCYEKAPAHPGGRYTRVPFALDRHAMNLD